MQTTPVRKARHSPKYIAGLTLASVAILVVGFLLRPRKPPSETIRPLSQTETQRLLRLAQRQSLDSMTGHFSAVAGDVASRLVPVGVAMIGGLAWPGELVITAGQGPVPEATSVTTPAGDELVATRAVSGPQLPLTAWRVAGLDGIAGGGRADARSPVSGQWILAVWLHEGGHAFAPGHYLDTRVTGCGDEMAEEVLSSLPLSDEMAGGGLFDLDGSLVAVVLPCGERHAALSPGSVSRMLAAGRTSEGRMLERYGMRVGAMSEALQEHLGVAGAVVVDEVWRGYAATEAGLRPGDALLMADEQPLSSPRDLEPLLLPSEPLPTTLRIRRDRRTFELTLDPSPPTARPAETGHSGVWLEPPARGYRIQAVLPGSRADLAGLRRGDRIVRIDNAVPRSPAEVQSALEGAGPAFLELERGGRRFGRLLGKR